MPYDTGRRLFASANPEGASQDPQNKAHIKARASRAGTRKVSTLNNEQLSRKRANDRKAQHAIRQRTRQHIERLENRIKDLSRYNPTPDAAHEAMQRRNMELEEELKQLRMTLFGVVEGLSSIRTSYHHPEFTPRSPTTMVRTPYAHQSGLPHSSWENTHDGFNDRPNLTHGVDFYGTNHQHLPAIDNIAYHMILHQASSRQSVGLGMTLKTRNMI